jgi:hypothetical protein
LLLGMRFTHSSGSSPLLGTKTEKYTPKGYFLCFVFEDLKPT